MEIKWFGDAIIKDNSLALAETTEKGAEVIASSARSNVKKVTGTLHDSIETTSATGIDGVEIAYAKVGSRESGGGGAYYAGFVDLGTKHIAGDRFFRNAVDANRSKVQGMLSDAVEKVLK